MEDTLAVEAAVRVLEDAPSLNAGRGSHPKSDGSIEMDALIMDGRTLALGAVAAIQRVRNPVSLARAVMDTPHALLAGAGASAFADSIAFPRCEASDLFVARDRPPATSDTVGAVARDLSGDLAAATSTGGVPRQLPGRVGEGSPEDGSTGGIIWRIIAFTTIRTMTGACYTRRLAALRGPPYVRNELDGWRPLEGRPTYGTNSMVGGPERAALRTRTRRDQ